MAGKAPSGPRCAAIVGPYLSGKTTLLESILQTCGAVQRKGSVKEGNCVGDGSVEARKRHSSTEISAASTSYLGEDWTFIDCPGSVELLQETLNALAVCDMAVLVCEPSEGKAWAVQPLLHHLDKHKIPHVLFINKMDHPQGSVRDTLDAMQAVSERPLVLREIPMRDGESVTGHVDLVSERAFRWNPGKPSELIPLPEDLANREAEARTELLESIADFDDDLLEKLLEDVVPESDEVYQSLARDLAQDLVVPVLFGSAEFENGITRLLKLLRHECPEAGQTAQRLGIKDGTATAQVFKTLHAGHAGKLSFARVWWGAVSDGTTLVGPRGEADRVAGLASMFGQKTEKRAAAGPGDVVALGRMEHASTGDILVEQGPPPQVAVPEPLAALLSMAVSAEHRADEVKLSSGLAKLAEEDPSLSYAPNPETGDLVLKGQGEVHLQIARDRLSNRFGLLVEMGPAQVAYKESIRKGTSRHARHKKQSGGHGEFGDVHVDIKPLPRGAGFAFNSTISGGAVPKQYIPAVETGIKEYMVRGPLGFTVVDVSVTLTDGQFHTVDSSEMAFKKAAALAMREGMPECGPVLLEPIMNVVLSIPNEFTSRIQRLISGRRGQILGFDAKHGWKDWDEVSAQLPEAEMHDLIIELRSATLGVGSYTASFDHLQELSGKEAEQVVQARAASAA